MEQQLVGFVFEYAPAMGLGMGIGWLLKISTDIRRKVTQLNGTVATHNDLFIRIKAVCPKLDGDG